MADEELESIEIELKDEQEERPEAEKEIVVEKDDKKEKPKGDPAADDLKEQLAASKKAQEESMAQLKAERSARDASDKAAAEKTAESIRFRHVADQSRYESINVAIKAKNDQSASTKESYRVAMEAGDHVAAAEAVGKISSIAQEIATLTTGKNALEQRFREEKDNPPVVDKYSMYSPRTAAWLKEHPECLPESQGGDRKKNALAMSAHHRALAEGHVPDTSEYFDFIETDMGYKEKPKDENAFEDEVEKPKPKPKPAKNGNGVAPVTRAVPGAQQRSPTRITLTPAQREAAKMAGIDEIEYAKQLVKLRDEGVVQ